LRRRDEERERERKREREKQREGGRKQEGKVTEKEMGRRGKGLRFTLGCWNPICMRVSRMKKRQR